MLRNRIHKSLIYTCVCIQFLFINTDLDKQIYDGATSFYFARILASCLFVKCIKYAKVCLWAGVLVPTYIADPLNLIRIKNSTKNKMSINKTRYKNKRHYVSWPNTNNIRFSLVFNIKVPTCMWSRVSSTIKQSNHLLHFPFCAISSAIFSVKYLHNLSYNFKP